MSDHKSLNLDLSIHEKERGKGYWKLNIKLLECKEYKLQVNTLIKDINKMEGSYIDKWEVLKSSIKEFSISFSVKRQRIYKKIISDIENELNEIENLPHTLIDMNRKRDLESHLNNFYDEKARGAQIRSRAKWISEDEKTQNSFSA